MHEGSKHRSRKLRAMETVGMWDTCMPARLDDDVTCLCSRKHSDLLGIESCSLIGRLSPRNRSERSGVTSAPVHPMAFRPRAHMQTMVMHVKISRPLKLGLIPPFPSICLLYSPCTLSTPLSAIRAASLKSSMLNTQEVSMAVEAVNPEHAIRHHPDEHPASAHCHFVASRRLARAYLHVISKVLSRGSVKAVSSESVSAR